MMRPILETQGFAAAVFDALSSNICVIDEQGVIVAVNRAWKNFTLTNPPVSDSTGLGSHYLDVCQSAEGHASEGAREFAQGLRAVLDGELELFEMEYPCPSPDKDRWFSGHVTPLKNSLRGAVVSHRDITDRKLLELELMKLATTDSLTGLPNRRYFTQAADLAVERVNRFGATASLIIADIDHFKTINDTHGHAVGDEALRCVTRVCEAPLRKSDVLARIGGEEFALMLPDTREAGAIIVAEKLREAISHARVRGVQSDFSITASFGVAEIGPGDKGVVAGLSRADAALYAAKHAGRNRVTGFTALPPDFRRPEFNN